MYNDMTDIPNIYTTALDFEDEPYEYLNHLYQKQKSGEDGRITPDTYIDNSLDRNYIQYNFSLKEVAKRGCRLFLNDDYKFMFQASSDSEIIEDISAKDLDTKLFLMNGASVRGVEDDKYIYPKRAPLSERELKVVGEYIYNPQERLLLFKTPSMYNYIYNKYHPSKLQLGQFYNYNLLYPLIIQNLYKDLTGNETYGEKYINDFVNRFHQTALAGNRHLVFNGHNTITVDLWFENILTPMFGEHNVVKIEDDELNKEFISKTVDRQIIYIKNIPSDAKKDVTKRIQELLKTLAPYTIVIFSTNNLEPIGIDKNSEDFTIFTPNDITGDYLKEGSYSSLGKVLEDSLPKYINYSYFNDVDKELIKNSLPTVAKDLVLSEPLNKIDLFIKNIQIKNIDYFKVLNNTIHTDLYNGLREDFYKNVVSKSSLAPLYNAFENTDYSAKAFLPKLRASTPLNKKFFDKRNSKPTEAGDELFIINSEFNEYRSMLEEE